MHLGIKVGPDNWREKLLESELDVHHIEIYYNFAYVDDYPPLFAWLRERGIEGRLHASTPLPGGVFATLATADREIRGAAADVARRTLDVAAQNRIQAVVVHPGSYLIPRLCDGRVEIVGQETSAEQGSRWLTEEVLRLVEYGRARGVEPLIENMPGREFSGYGPMDRTSAVDVRFVPYTVLRDLGRAGVQLCVDIAHLYTERMVEGDPLKWPSARHNGLYPRVLDAAEELAPYARHLHLSTITAPWNGTDGHSGFLEADYALDAIPTRDQLISLLERFAAHERKLVARHDPAPLVGHNPAPLAGHNPAPLAGHNPAPLAGQETWIIPEPNGGAQAHLANYGRLRKWLRGRS